MLHFEHLYSNYRQALIVKKTKINPSPVLQNSYIANIAGTFLKIHVFLTIFFQVCLGMDHHAVSHPIVDARVFPALPHLCYPGSVSNVNDVSKSISVNRALVLDLVAMISVLAC